MASFSFSPRVLLASSLALRVVLAGTPTVCTNPQLSCANSTAVADLCCFNAPGGQMLQTQFWDTNPATGPSDSWTIHGLWPDHCDGTFDANCDTTRAYTNIAGLLQAAGKVDTLSYMQTYWKDYQGQDETFWEHEWAKHGTCITTLDPKCFTGYTPQEEAADFFEKTVDLFKSLNSYAALSKAGIVPSSTATYTSAQIQSALKAMFGYEVTLQCSSGALNQIWYTYGVRGSVVTGEFVPTVPNGSKTTCPTTGIKYLPKPGGVVPTTTGAPGTTSSTGTTATTGSPTVTPPAGGTFSGSGHVNAITGGSQQGCLIGAGTWYVGGTCATYTATASGSGFTLQSSKGSCGVLSSVITCGSGVTATVFTSSGGNLAYNGNTDFYAAALPSGSTQQSVHTDSQSVTVNFQWQSV